MTLMMFLNSMPSSTLWRGYSSACSSISGLMIALATCSEAKASVRPLSTRSRSCLLSFTTSRNWRMSSSRLSFMSLWPRRAVLSLPLSCLSIILVGAIVVLAIKLPPYFMYFSISSGFIRFSSALGRMLSSFQPRSRVS